MVHRNAPLSRPAGSGLDATPDDVPVLIGFHQDLDLVVLTGDVADHSRTAEYETVRQVTATRHPLLVCPGNHDDREAFRRTLLGVPSSAGPTAPMEPTVPIEPIEPTAPINQVHRSGRPSAWPWSPRPGSVRPPDAAASRPPRCSGPACGRRAAERRRLPGRTRAHRRRHAVRRAAAAGRAGSGRHGAAALGGRAVGALGPSAVARLPRRGRPAPDHHALSQRRVIRSGNCGDADPQRILGPPEPCTRDLRQEHVQYSRRLPGTDTAFAHRGAGGGPDRGLRTDAPVPAGSAARVHALGQRIPGLTGGEGVPESAFDHFAPVSGVEVPEHARWDANPLDRKEYVMRVQRTV